MNENKIKLIMLILIKQILLMKTFKNVSENLATASSSDHRSPLVAV